MPVNSEGVNVNYTRNIDVQYLMQTTGDDFCVEFTGYLVSILGIKKVGDEKEDDLLRAVISNGYKNIMLLVYDEVKIKEMTEVFVTNRILHLDSCHGRVVRSQPEHKVLNLINYEIIIQRNSFVEMKGFHVKLTKQKKEIPMVAFIDLAKAKGEVKVKAYIKTPVTVAYNRNGPMSFGSGAITDGSHKLPIQVQSFAAENSTHLSKGCCVLVTGTVNTEPLKLVCKNFAAIEILKDETSLPIEKVQEANKPLNLKRSEGIKNGNEPPSKKG